VEANSTGGQGSRRAVAPSDDDDDDDDEINYELPLYAVSSILQLLPLFCFQIFIAAAHSVHFNSLKTDIHPNHVRL
jgi:hypothetical protein